MEIDFQSKNDLGNDVFIIWKNFSFKALSPDE